MTDIILASTSPARKELLEKTGLVFHVEPSNFDETQVQTANPEELVRTLALGKARTVAQRNLAAIVIGADTIIFHQNKIVGKPNSVEEARNLLKSYCTMPHKVYTGIAVIQGTKEISDVVIATVTFRNLSDEEIERYLHSYEPFGNAGAYTIQRKGAALIEKIEGDYNAVIGLPLFKLFGILREFGVQPLRFMTASPTTNHYTTAQ